MSKFKKTSFISLRSKLDSHKIWSFPNPWKSIFYCSNKIVRLNSTGAVDQSFVSIVFWGGCKSRCSALMIAAGAQAKRNKHGCAGGRTRRSSCWISFWKIMEDFFTEKWAKGRTLCISWEEIYMSYVRIWQELDLWACTAGLSRYCDWLKTKDSSK